MSNWVKKQAKHLTQGKHCDFCPEQLITTLPFVTFKCFCFFLPWTSWMLSWTPDINFALGVCFESPHLWHFSLNKINHLSTIMWKRRDPRDKFNVSFYSLFNLIPCFVWWILLFFYWPVFTSKTCHEWLIMAVHEKAIRPKFYKSLLNTREKIWGFFHSNGFQVLFNTHLQYLFQNKYINFD